MTKGKTFYKGSKTILTLRRTVSDTEIPMSNIEHILPIFTVLSHENDDFD
jgi:hypothetical protein